MSLIGLFGTGRDRRELARDVFKEEPLFIGCGSSERDDADAFRGFCVNDGDWRALQEAEGYEALFAILEPIVLVRSR